MDANALTLAVQQSQYAAVGVAFLAGLLFSVNPVAIAAIPVSLAYVTRARERPTALRFGAMFILGLIFTHVVLGVVAGFGGVFVKQLLGRYWGVVLGPVLILMGLLWPGWIKIPLPAASFRAKRATGVWGAFALGIPFSVAICPFCTPCAPRLARRRRRTECARIRGCHSSGVCAGPCGAYRTWRVGHGLA